MRLTLQAGAPFGPAPARRPRRPVGRRWSPEALEPRLVLTTTFTQTNLVSEVPGMAKATDPNLVNPWGLALGLNSGIWIAENGSGMATSYDGNGQPLPTTSG